MDKNNPLQQTTKPRKTYSCPQLSLYGDVAQLTRNGTGVGNDGGTPGQSRMCWIAEALYGLDSPRTLLVRSWLTESYERRAWWALVAVPLYRRFGQRVADRVQRDFVLRAFIQPLFDYAVCQAHREYAFRALLLTPAA